MHSPPFFDMRLTLVMAATVLLTGCNIPGLDGDQKAAAAQAEAKAIGGACRHALRGIEDCYEQNPDAIKSAVFAGWKEMDEYMRENKLEGIPPPKPPKEEPEIITEKADKADGKKPANKPKAATH
jgi:hypothetical protein